MSKAMKITVIGAGSNYTPELIQGIINHNKEELPIDEIVMHDSDEERLQIMTDLAQRMFKHYKKDILIHQEPNLKDSVKDSNFIISQIRVGGINGRIIDEKIPLKYGYLGQETTGIGGMFKALRTIPEMLKIGNTIYSENKQAILLNYTNPSGIITEALSKYSKINIIGLCSGLYSMQKELALRLNRVYPKIKSSCVGLNHLGFIHKILSDQLDVTNEAIQFLTKEHKDNFKSDNGKLSLNKINDVIQAIPIGYVNYFFHRKKKVQEALQSEETRGELIRQIQNEVFEEAKSTSCSTYPTALKKRGGGGYSEVTFDCLKAIWHNQEDEIACNVQNQGSIHGIDDDAVVEVVCKVNRKGATPQKVGKIPLSIRGIIQSVKAFESLTVEAAITKNKNLVYQALLNHPLVGDFDDIEQIVEEMLHAHQLDFN